MGSEMCIRDRVEVRQVRGRVGSSLNRTVFLQAGRARASDEIAALMERRKELSAQKRTVQREIQNAAKRHRRIMQKAASLTDEEMLQVLAVRAAKAKAKARPRPGG